MIALLHDLVFTVGIYALTGFEVTPASMIGFLTVLGYSLYDTVVVFDKVRENTQEAFGNKRMTYAEAANLAVNQTLVRSINTTVVALLPIAAILVVGLHRARPRHPARPVAWRCSSGSRSAPTPRSSSPRRCWSRPARQGARRRGARQGRGEVPRQAGQGRRGRGLACPGPRLRPSRQRPQARAPQRRAPSSARGQCREQRRRRPQDPPLRPDRAAQPAQARSQVAALR